MDRYKDRLNSPFLVLAITAVAYLSFIYVQLARHEYDPSYFITAGDVFVDPSLVPQDIKVMPHSHGYDGQFYYRLAQNPFTSIRTEFGVTLDLPPYRQQRLGYPLLTWALSLGRPALVPWTMVLVNYVALCLISWISGRLAQSLGRNAIWGILLPFYPGFLLVLSRDLAEILVAFLVLASLLQLRREKHVIATVLLIAAIFTKETALLIAISALFTFLMRGGRFTILHPRPRWYFFSAPIFVYIAWQVWLSQRWREFPLLSGGQNLGLPFAAVTRFFLQTASWETHVEYVWFVELCFIVIFVVLVIYSLHQSLALGIEKVSWLLYLILVSALSSVVWVEDWAFMRALVEFYVLGAIILIGASSWIRTSAVIASASLWVFLFRDLVNFR